MRLFTKGMAKQWSPTDIDFSQDVRDFAAMNDNERLMTTRWPPSSSPGRSR